MWESERKEDVVCARLGPEEESGSWLWMECAGMVGRFNGQSQCGLETRTSRLAKMRQRTMARMEADGTVSTVVFREGWEKAGRQENN